MAEIDFLKGKDQYERLAVDTFLSLKLKDPKEQLDIQCNATCS